MKKKIFYGLCLAGFLAMPLSASPFSPLPTPYEGPANWQIYHYDDFGFSVNSPYPIDTHITREKTPEGDPVDQIKGEEIYTASEINTSVAADYTHDNPQYHYFIVESQKMADPGKSIDAKEVVDRKIRELKKITTIKGIDIRNFKCEFGSVRWSGIPCVLLTASWDDYNRKGYCYTDHTKVYLAFRGGRYWMLRSSTSRPDKFQGELDRTAESFRIADSLKNPVVDPAKAGTDAKTVEFLQKLNGLYYCLGRAGLKGYTCDATFTLSELYKENLRKAGVDPKVAGVLDGQKLTVKMPVDGDAEIDIVQPPVGGDPAFDQQLGRQIQHIANGLTSTLVIWGGDTMVPPIGPDDFKKRCRILKEPGGFTLEEDDLSDGSVWKYFYDKQSRRTGNTIVQNGKTFVEWKMKYSSTPKGYRLGFSSWNSQTEGMGGTDDFSYARVGKYDLPSKLVEELKKNSEAQWGAAVTFTFSNYKLDE